MRHAFTSNIAHIISACFVLFEGDHLPVWSSSSGFSFRQQYTAGKVVTAVIPKNPYVQDDVRKYHSQIDITVTALLATCHPGYANTVNAKF